MIEYLVVLLLFVAFVGALAVLLHEWRWRHAAARPPLPGSRLARRLAAVVDASVAMHLIRGAFGSDRDGAGAAPDEPRRAVGDATAGPSATAPATRIVRPTRIVVSGVAGPALTGVRTPPRGGDRRTRFVRDTAAVLGLALAAIIAVGLLPRGMESGVLGATGTPAPTDPAALVASPSSGTEAPSPPAASPSDDLAASAEPSATSAAPSAPGSITPVPASAPPAASPSPTPRVTPRPTATPRPTPRPSPSPAPSPSAAQPSPSSTTSPSEIPGPSPSPSPSPSPNPSPSPSPSPTAAP